MKITTFDPIIVSKEADAAIKLFEELGFQKTHAPVTLTETGDVSTVRMKNEGGFHVDVAQVGVPKDYTLIRMNVDDFEEAYNILKSHGFTNTRGDDTLDTKSSKAATMVSPSGFRIALVKHIKKDEG
ncbi:glyoxalase/bleomycin resistance/dioxygenase family protein [Oribacterium sp. P6A1]|uniref:glyoxalase/bleomycin resistance/dioxygenase family protein n=1 Tax=Oribacterium sp. P6A1 TaxID=1410612 RepID=UPI0005683289|nr:glyoxalase/bleomycin resistance/dioxygenase family protein [Oribacterium sp. P6A1]